MKSWYVTVLKNNFKQVECIKCVSAQTATERLKEMKEKYVNVPATETEPAIVYTFFREQF